jgi:hypothetical protein
MMLDSAVLLLSRSLAGASKKGRASGTDREYDPADAMERPSRTM